MSEKLVVEVQAAEPDVRVAIDVTNTGKDGYTPQRGVDYWTEADQAEIRRYVNEQLEDVEIGGGAVVSVNGKTGAVVLSASDVGADLSGSAAAAQAAAQKYADDAIAKIPTPDVSGQIGVHNASTAAHGDIRTLISGLTERLNALADSDDTTLDQLSEIVAYIKSNKSLIDAVTTSKVSIADVVNNLTTNVSDKPLSAAQGVALKALIDAITVPTKLSQLAEDTTHRLVTDAEKSSWNAKSNFSGAYADLTGKPTIPTVPSKVSAFENDAGYLVHQDVNGKLDASRLPEVIDAALAQAKESGEFDGEDGEPGQPGTDGISPTISVSKSGKVTTISITDKNGVKTATVNDGADGSPGATGSNGKDGTSVTVKSVSESTADGGSNVVAFSDGKTLTVKNGGKGSTGATGAAGKDGKTPVRGTDYWTDADQEAIVQQVIAALGTPVFGRVDADNNIILNGELSDGIYNVKYENAEGEAVDIGRIEIGGVVIVNELPISTDTDGSIYNGIGYRAATRINSGGAAADYADTYASGFIPVSPGDTLYFKNVVAYCGGDNNVSNHRIALYDASKTFLGEASFWYLFQSSNVSAGNAQSSAWNAPLFLKLVDVVSSSTTGIDKWNGKVANVAFVRLSVLTFNTNSEITINGTL